MFRKLSVALVAPLMIVVAACAKEADSPQARTEVRTEARTGAEAVAALQSAPDAAAEAGSGRMRMVIEMDVLGQAVEMVATGEYAGDQMHMAMDMGDMFDQLGADSGEPMPEGFDTSMEFVQDGTTVYMRMPMLEFLTGTSDWLSMTAEDVGVSAEDLGTGAMDPTALLDSLRGVDSEPVPVGEEEIDGVPTTHYTATLDLEQALEQVPEDQRPLVESQLEQLGSGVIEVDIWIDHDDLPRRMQMDMSDMVAQMTGGQSGTATATMDFFDYGEPVDIEIPSPDEVTPFIEVFGELGDLDPEAGLGS
jgi:hypothetical protein